MALIKKEFLNLDLLYYFIDSAPSQYKNYKDFSNLYYHLHDMAYKLNVISLQQVMVKVPVME